MTLKVGDRVHWTDIKHRGKEITMSRREGAIAQLLPTRAIVKLWSGREVRVIYTRLRAIDAPSQITEFVEAVREANR